MAVIKFNFNSETLSQQVNVTLILPTHSFMDTRKGRDAEAYYQSGMKYQTLWLLHGGGGDDSDYVTFSNIARYADEHKVAVVCPADYNQYYPGNETNTTYLRPLGAFFELKGTEARVINFQEADGSMTAIDVTKAETNVSASEGWYTINGMKLDAAPTEKGIYINNGKKVVVK